MSQRFLTSQLLLAFFVMVLSGCARTGPAREHQPVEKETISIGYGEIDKENATGSVAVLSEDELQRHAAIDVVDLIRGRLPGVQVVQTAGGAHLRIRGIHTLQGPQEPLIVVDGTQLLPGSSGLFFLNPHDIERIEVLKGAAAAIYGSRGGNGVVLITTRR